MHTLKRHLSILVLLLSLHAAYAQAGDDPTPAMAMGGRMVRGTVTAVAPDRITLKTETGELFQVAVSANTQVRKGREQAKLTDIRAGDGVGAMGEIDPATKTVHALFLSFVDAEQMKKLRDELGKSYIVGKVTAIDETRLTVLRSDNVSQTIEVDEDTSFRRGGRGTGGPGMYGGLAGGPRAGQQMPGQDSAARRGPRPATGDEALTLADVKVGDTVAGPGAVRHGIFVSSQLGVMTPGARRRPRPGAGTDAGPAGPQ